MLEIFFYLWNFSQPKKIFRGYGFSDDPQMGWLLWTEQLRGERQNWNCLKGDNLQEKWGGSFSSCNEAGCKLEVTVCQKLLVMDGCLNDHCQQGNCGEPLEWFTSDLFITLTRALGFVLALVRGTGANKNRDKELLAWSKSEQHFTQSLTSFPEVCYSTVDADWLCVWMN